MDALRRSIEESAGAPPSNKAKAPARRAAAGKPEQPKRRKTKAG